MIPIRGDVRVWLATDRTDMRKGVNGLARQVQQSLGRDPHAGDLFVFRGARASLIKIIWHDGIGGGAEGSAGHPSARGMAPEVCRFTPSGLNRASLRGR